MLVGWGAKQYYFRYQEFYCLQRREWFDNAWMFLFLLRFPPEMKLGIKVTIDCFKVIYEGLWGFLLLIRWSGQNSYMSKIISCLVDVGLFVRLKSQQSFSRIKNLYKLNFLHNGRPNVQLRSNFSLRGGGLRLCEALSSCIT